MSYRWPGIRRNPASGGQLRWAATTPAGAGPYYVKSWVKNRQAVFVRNPNYSAKTDSKARRSGCSDRNPPVTGVSPVVEFSEPASTPINTRRDERNR